MSKLYIQLKWTNGRNALRETTSGFKEETLDQYFDRAKGLKTFEIPNPDGVGNIKKEVETEAEAILRMKYYASKNPKARVVLSTRDFYNNFFVKTMDLTNSKMLTTLESLEQKVYIFIATIESDGITLTDAEKSAVDFDYASFNLDSFKDTFATMPIEKNQTNDKVMLTNAYKWLSFFKIVKPKIALLEKWNPIKYQVDIDETDYLDQAYDGHSVNDGSTTDKDIVFSIWNKMYVKTVDASVNPIVYTFRGINEMYFTFLDPVIDMVDYSFNHKLDRSALNKLRVLQGDGIDHIPTPHFQIGKIEEMKQILQDQYGIVGIADFDFTGKSQADVYETFKSYTTGTIFKLKQGIKIDVSNSEAGVEEWDLPANQTAEVVFNTNNHLILRVEAITGIAKETRIIYITGKGIDGNVSTPSSKILFSEEQFNRNDIFTLDNDAVEADEFKKLSKAISSGYGVFELERGNVIFTFTRYEIGGAGISLYTSLKDDGSSQKLTLTNNVADKVSGINMVSIPLSVELDNLSDDLKTKLDLLSDIKKHQNVYVGQWKKDTGISNLKSVNEIMSETNPFTYSTGAQSDIFQLNFNTALMKGLPGGVWNLDILLISSGTDNFYINNINSGTPVRVVSNQVRRWKDTIKATIGKGDGGWLLNDLDFANPMRVNFKIINNGDHVHIKKQADRYQEIPTNRLSTSFVPEAYYHFDGTSVLYTEDINKRVFDYSIELEIRNRYGRVSNMKEIFVIFTREVSE